MGAIFILVFGFQIFPAPFYIFYHPENLSMQSIGKAAPGALIYFLPAILASIVNIFCKIVSFLLKSVDQQWMDKFSFSIGASIVTSLSMLLFALSTFVNRYWRMILIYPLLMFTFLVILPLYIIWSNDKMKTCFKEEVSNVSRKIRSTFCKNCKRKVTNVVHPA